MAKGSQFRNQRALATIYLAREELISGTIEADTALELAIRETKRLPDPAIKMAQVILNGVLDLKTSQAQSAHTRR